MNKIFAIFFSIVMLTIGSFALLWAINPTKEKQQVMASQGIILVGSTTFYDTQDNSNPKKLRVGDLFLSSNGKVYRVNEIRKAQSNDIYVVVSWKDITDYKSYAEYSSVPYTNYATYELNNFVYKKTLISQKDLEAFYSKYASDLQIRNYTPSQISNYLIANKIAVKPVEEAINPRSLVTPYGIAPTDAAPKVVGSMITPKTQAFPTESVSIPEDLSRHDENDIKQLGTKSP